VVIPWRGNIAFLIKMFPVSVQDRVTKALGLQDQMNDFKGKGDITKRIPGLGSK